MSANLAIKFKPVILAALALACAVAQDASQWPANLVWQDVSSTYKRFDEITPVLVNNGEKSVFLSRLWPNGSAHLQRLSEATGDWEAGDWSGSCASVSQATVPIEIKPRTERKIYVYWQLSTDDWDKPKHFIVGGSREERPIEGRYRFDLDYSLRPWTVFQRPARIYTIVSPEFLVGGQ
jgi:hypothetical protein